MSISNCGLVGFFERARELAFGESMELFRMQAPRLICLSVRPFFEYTISGAKATRVGGTCECWKVVLSCSEISY
jgi:hypothetical protein